MTPVQHRDTQPDAATMRYASHADTATGLLHAMAALPVGHPSRPVLRREAIEAWLPLARHLAHRYAGRGEPTDDLVQTATIGLIKAVDRFDPGFGVDFAGFAIPTIVGELKRHFRDRTWSIRVPRRLQELRLAITAANALLTHTLGRLPTVPDIAAHLNVTEDDVLEGLEGARAYSTTSLSTPVRADGETELGDTSAAKTTSSHSPNYASLWARPWPPSTHASRRSSRCGSTATTPRPRSPNRSASPRCTSHG